jgi:1-acyl-sn-glycerol-3-phosphate acyltransferase
MTTLRSLLFNLLFLIWTAGMFVICLPFLASPRRIIERVGDIWIGGVLLALRLICGLSYEVRGLENLPKGSCIVASKHQSAFDTIIFSRFLPETAYVLKKELMAIPCFGWYLTRTGMIPVDRSGGTKALKEMIGEARRAVADGRPILIFPEGTRTAPGSSKPYHPGVAALYKALDLPVVPVALNSGLYWPRRSFLKHPGTILLEILPPIPPSQDRKTFMERLRADIETASHRLSEKPVDDRG